MLCLDHTHMCAYVYTHSVTHYILVVVKFSNAVKRIHTLPEVDIGSDHILTAGIRNNEDENKTSKD